MEKKIWSKPEMHEFAFAANEYVAACGDNGSKYLFKCDAWGGVLHYFKNLLVSKDAAQPKWDEVDYSQAGDTTIGSYFPCGREHEASTSSDFYWGYIDYDRDNSHDPNGGTLGLLPTPKETVIVWRGPNGNNGHATKNLNINDWEVAKS